MKRKVLFKYLSFFIFLIFILNFIAGKLHLYYIVSFYDLMMHFLGGFWLSICFLWIFYNQINKKSTKNTIIKVFSGVILISLAWEFYEIFINNIFTKDNLDYLDIFTDLFADIIGAVISYLIFIKILIKKRNSI